MKTVSLRLSFLAMVLAFTASQSLADTSMTILHTNDFHSRVEPISKYDSGCSAEDNAEGKCFGGYARMVTAVAEARKRNPDALLVDGGDQFQGSLFYTYYKGAVAAEIMNALQYDGMTVGNHEFDDGPEVLRGFMDKVEFPVLMSNADVSKEPALANKLMKSTVIEKAGQKIGLIGLTPENTAELASPGKAITFSDPVEAVRGEVAVLSEAGVNIIVVLSHSGYRTDLRVAEEVEGVDVIVGGHSNTLLSKMGLLQKMQMCLHELPILRSPLMRFVTKWLRPQLRLSKVTVISVARKNVQWVIWSLMPCWHELPIRVSLLR